MSDPRLTTEALRGYATARENGGRGDVPTVVAAMAIELIELREHVRRMEILVGHAETAEAMERGGEWTLTYDPTSRTSLCRWRTPGGDHSADAGRDPGDERTCSGSGGRDE